MLWLLFSLSALAQNEPDLEAVKKIEKELPQTPTIESEENQRYRVEKRKFKRPYRAIGIEEIMNSGVEYGHIKKDRTIIALKDNSQHKVTEAFNGKFFRHPDEHGFKYIQNNDGSCTFKVQGDYFVAISQELELYEPPLRYTPAPKNIHRNVYDSSLSLLPEAAFYAGATQGTYMKDLFKDSEAASGHTTQFAFILSTKWKYPIKLGAVLNHERSQYGLSDGGKIRYSSTSLGPQFKSKDFYLGEFALRFQTQFRISPFAKLEAELPNRDLSFKFNSSDLFMSLEHPIKNSWGAFVVGVFFQSQWLNIKDQQYAVNVSASNATNKFYGLSFSQVFE